MEDPGGDEPASNNNNPNNHQLPETNVEVPQVNRNAVAPVNNSRRNRQNYTRDEVLSFLTILERELPIGGDEWQHVKELHAREWPNRTVESLRRKFADLYQKKSKQEQQHSLQKSRLPRESTSRLGGRLIFPMG